MESKKMSLWTDLMGHSFELSQVDVNGISTRTLRMGSGTPVIFLHGISGHLEAFVRTAPFHSKHFEVHLIDMLGHGYTDKPDGMYTVDRLAQHVIDYMDARGIEKAHVCGISLGGWVTGWLLAHHADRLLRSTMILAAGNPAMGSPQIAELICRTTTAAVMSDDRDFTRQRLAQVIHRQELLTDELVDVRYKIYHLPDFRAHLDNMLGATEHAVYQQFMLKPELLQQIEQETLLAWSEEDAYSDVLGAGHYQEHIRRNKLVVFADAGHWPPYERPEDFATVNVAFLGGGLEAISAGVI
jgi:2-hydroxy-6-oxonona-2,4-dienedioate hydrolase